MGLLCLFWLLPMGALAQEDPQQIKIGGNVYGGGNEGYVGGNATVTVRAGDLNSVFGGARVANVGGRTFVNIDGKHASDDILIVNVYGGNDISGTIGQSGEATTVPAELENVKTDDDDSNRKHNAIDNTWKTFVCTSASDPQTETIGTGDDATTVTADSKMIVIGSLFGGGNGDYKYETTGDGDYQHNVYNLPYNDGDEPIVSKVTEPGEAGFALPELPMTYLEIKGGNIAHIYGGGNNATVTEATTINIDNSSSDLVKAATLYAYRKGITDDLSTVLASLKTKVKLTTFQTNLSSIASYAFNHARIFGGNNKATMNIMPKWNLQKGIIRDLYSGGNEGDMTYRLGLLLDIDPVDENKDKLSIINVYGGCRRADVYPLQDDGTLSTATQMQLPNTIVDNYGKPYRIPDGLSARTIIRGGKITNVYGGNDISGRVFGGNAVGIRTSILGDVYGGGNGSYAYTDNADLGKLDEYKDFYYNTDSVKAKEKKYNPAYDETQTLSSVEALNIFRPNAEQVSVRLWGGSAENPTIIGGSVYVGGNSATLKPKLDLAEGDEQLVELKIGSHVYADKVFLGNNGEKMVDASDGGTLSLFAGDLTDNGVAYDFSQINLADKDQFATYMDGCAMTMRPRVVFDLKINENVGDADTYKPYSSYFGSLFCGGNVGSMKFAGSSTFDFTEKFIIFDKLVGGSNSADIPEHTGLNAAYSGGVLEAPDTDGNKLVLNLSGVRLQPKRWVVERDGDYNRVLRNPLTNEVVTDPTQGQVTYLSPDPTSGSTASRYLEWNTWLDKKETPPVTSGAFTTDDLSRRLVGGNVYGGCCESGHVNGNIVINLNGTTVDRAGEHGVFDTATPTDGDPDILYDHEGYTISERRSGVILDEQGTDVLGEALSIFGGGKGKGTEVWGKTTVNLNSGYSFQVFGGSESGVIGMSREDSGKEVQSGDYVFNGQHYGYDPKYSAYVYLNGPSDHPGASRNDDPSEEMPDTEYLYGGGFEGPVIGNTYAYLNNGRLFNLFAGACNADIVGHTETYVGLDGFPYMRDHIYCGNDLGGSVLGDADFSGKVRDYAHDKTMIHGYKAPAPGGAEAVPDVLKANTYLEYLQGHTVNIFGGHSGNYDYEGDYSAFMDKIPHLHNSFVNIRPIGDGNNQIEKVFGAGEGYSGLRISDKMQDRSYVLIDIADGLEKFTTTEVFGSGSDCGLGMKYPADETLAKDEYGNPTFNLDEASAIIDLLRGKIGNVFGGSYNEGVTRRTVVNVPENSTVWLYSDEPDEDEESDGTKTKHEKMFGNIHGGAYGTLILPPCDVYESNVNYRSDKAIVNGSIFGGNNSERRTLYANVNIYSPVWSREDKEVSGYLSTVYGAGKGKDTWAEHTQVNLWPGAKVYEVYGGGMMGHVLNAESVQRYMNTYTDKPSAEITAKNPKWSQDKYWELDASGNKDHLKTGKLNETDEKTIPQQWADDWADAWTLGDYYKPDVEGGYNYTTYVTNDATNFDQISDRPELVEDAKITAQFPSTKFNANVIINEGAYVANYAYGGGYGKKKEPLSGDVYGTTYIALLGGQVKKDIYAAGTSGSIYDLFNTKNKTTGKYAFTASSNAYVKGGTCRNVYGGGWEGGVGYHAGAISADPSGDIPGETYVVIGREESKVRTDSLALAGAAINKHGFYYGRPVIQRNAYGGGEGGAVYGTAHLTLNNGYIGYVFDPSGSDDSGTSSFDERYVEKIEDETYLDEKTQELIPNTRLKMAGCLFGGGYVDNSSVDKTNVYIYGGHVRNSAFGGGEIAAIGRGTISKTTSGGSTSYSLSGLHRPGKTLIEMYGGHVHHSVYGGGRGYDNLNKHGSLNSDGYVFGQTEVHVHGGEIGTKAELSDSVGNVFGGGDVGFVYSAYENADGTFGKGVKSGKRYNEGLDASDPEYNYLGYYYKHKWDNNSQDEDQFEHENLTERVYTEDCRVLVEPFCKANSELTIENIFYPKSATVSHLDYKYLQDHNISTEGLDADSNVTADAGFTISSRTYSPGEYVPAYALNALGKKSGDSRWSSLDPTGIIIHNAVFAGGNTSTTSTSGSGGVNTPSVFGNATASIHDVYHRDLITLGTRHTGGLYGDGNMTLVDGYRELNITNYGTDYYSIAKEISNSDYHALPERERDYYELIYTCQKDCQDKDGTSYKKATTDADGFVSKASTISADELLSLFLILDENNNPVASVMDGNTAIMSQEGNEWKPNPEYWIESGVLPVYAGRLMNSIQRADFCGVYGSRMVMQGARDRVPKEADFTNYTINRVREVSLNKKMSVISSDTGDDAMHGNYFGIYNIVNYLGALTSDVDFHTAIRTTGNTEYQKPITLNSSEIAYGTATFEQWKEAHKIERMRNNGNSHNKVALASGVYLELTSEESTGTGLFEKKWGPITGVVELDLINVSTGIGGGFVYAKNIHGVRTASGLKNTTLTALNRGAVTQKDYKYDTDDGNKKEWETSGNFVHSTQTIIDDCYNVSNRYTGAENPDGSEAMPAHYWYIKGSVYVYPQLISAHTGMPNAYSEAVEIPLTISAASHGTIKLLNVQPNRYAFYSSPGVELGTGKKVVINDKEYYKNDPISYWDWYLLSQSEKQLFVEETYVNCMACKIDGTAYEAGKYVMTKSQYDAFKVQTHTYTDDEGKDVMNGDNVATTDYIFRLSNNLGHDTGYILTYEVNNPEIWNTWYTPKKDTDGSKITLAAYEALEVTSTASALGKDAYYDGPTYRLKATTGGEVLGQRDYKVGDIISKTIQDAYTTIPSDVTLTDQATFAQAYIVTKAQTIQETNNGNTVDRHLNPGVVVGTTSGLEENSYEEAYVCTSTIKLSDTEFIFRDTKMKKSEWQDYCDRFSGTTDAEKKIKAEILSKVVPAYYCTADGLYGGRYYQSNYNYRGLEAFSSMSQEDRDKFDFNYDALDLLIDPDYTNPKTGPYSEGQKYQYDGNYSSEDQVNGKVEDIAGNKAGYSVIQSIDYTASYTGSTALPVGKEITVQRKNATTGKTESISTSSVQTGDELSRDDFEALPNDRRHYSPIVVKDGTKHYVVNTPFQIGSTPYAVGNTISSATYNGLPLTERGYVTELTFPEYGDNIVYYYCREKYKNGTGTDAVTAVSTVTGAAGGITDDGYVLPGTIISSSDYSELPNDQKDFTIHGISPTETSTLFVSRESDIHDLSQDKIITVIYQYDYEESDATGNITPVSERHVVNIRIQFKSGVPIVEDIDAPDIILPGDYIAPVEPNVIFDANALLEPGWELYETERDAQNHINGVRFDGGASFNPVENPLYWYQDGWYLAYYISSIESGRTYSNYVPVSVANYHDLKKVMTAKDHHYYIDEKGVKRYPKIYINDYSKDAEGSKNGLDLFKNLFDLSVLDNPTINANGIITDEGTFNGHHTLGNRVRAGRNLEFFLRTDIDRPCTTENPWAPIGREDDPSTTDVNESECFDGTLHGDGHTISGLDHSLFGKLCGSVYNLGVTGSFNTAGIADEGDGYVENCWVKTSNESPLETKPYAVFGNPTDTKGCQVANSYFCIDNKALYETNATETASGGDRGVATAKSARAFYNGEVAYDLNSSYLNKRYYDHQSLSGETDPYSYLPSNADGTLSEEPITSNYPKTPDAAYGNLGYVENRFADGDFIYAGGSIPTEADVRLRPFTDSQGNVVNEYYPIWPDDYLFFGQKLTYGHLDGQEHQATPSAINRSAGRVLTDISGNRVYRAPAYYRSSEMGVAHFNPYAVFAQTKNGDANTLAYKDMTAIDFTGYHEALAANGANGAYGKGMVAATSSLPQRFYPPLLDDDGLTGFLNVDLTRNLLVYTAAAGAGTTAAEKTATVVGSYLTEPAYTESTEGYRTVAGLLTTDINGIHGHWVENGTATRDHFLVDKQDFNVPISYTFATDKRMWYQRVPDNYVDHVWSSDATPVRTTKGWEGISLPFSAELVTTNQKGEITHFFSGSETSKNGTNSKIGHEYWLRRLENGSTMTQKTDKIFEASFNYPSTTDGSMLFNKTGDNGVTNTFLWDYYYEGVTGGHSQQDNNNDTYQEYYSGPRYYASYPLLTNGTPYILGLPGKTFYEFDLSGDWDALTTASTKPAKLGKQTITFASVPGTTIQVSDGETGGSTATYSSKDYTFEANYLNSPNLETGKHAFLLNADGNSYVEDNSATTTVGVSAFRPYFMAPPVSLSREVTRSIVFSQNGAELGDGGNGDEDPGTLSAHAERHKIVVSSTKRYATDVRIVNTAGQVIASFTLRQGETVETPINNAGIFIVQEEGGRFIKKLAVE